MEVLQQLSSLFFSGVLHVVDSAPFICYLIILGWLAAIIFNIIDRFMEER